MKKNLKRAIALLLAMTLLFVCVPLNAEAAKKAKGSSGNPVKLGTKGSCTTTWKYNIYYFYSFKMTKQGYVTINLSKPKDTYYGGKTSFYMFMYDSKGNEIWNCRTDGQASLKSQKYTYKVGLKKGSYKLKVKPMRLGPYCTVKSKISIKTTANAYWEIESNETFAKANTIKTGKTYKGLYGENIAGDDYYKIFLKKGQCYKIVVGGSKALFADTTQCKVYDPNMQENVMLLNSSTSAGYCIDHIGYTVIQAQATGYFYIRIYNSMGWKNPGRPYTLTVNPI